MTAREQKESVCGFKNKKKKEEEKEKKRKKRIILQNVFTNGFLDSILSAVCKGKKEKNRLVFYIIKYITT